MAVPTFLLAKGCAHSEETFVQKFDPALDEDEEIVRGEITAQRKACGIVQNIGKNQLISAAVGVATRTHVPGLVFGLSTVVAGQVGKHIHQRRVSAVGCKLSVEALRVADLTDIRVDQKLFLAMSPYVSVQLVMEGCDAKSDAFKARTCAMSGGGTSCVFPPQSIASVGLRLDDPTAAANACLYVKVKDEPDFGLVGKTLRETFIGSAMVSLEPLVSAIVNEGVNTAGSNVNLHLYKQAELGDPNALPSGGTILLHISIEVLTELANVAKPTDEVSSAEAPLDETLPDTKSLDEASLQALPIADASA